MAQLYYLPPLPLTDTAGAAAASLPVKVTGGTVYLDSGGLSPVANNEPITGPGGQVSFWAAAGSYTLKYTPANGNLVTLSVTLPYAPSTTSSGSSQNLAVRAMVGQSVTTRSNLEFPVFSGPLVDTAGASVAASGVMAAVPVPVDVGMLISKVSIIVGATAASTPTHSFGAIYSGTTVASPPLIGQSTDGATAAITASGRLDFTLTTANVVTSAQAPNGWLWAVYSVTATTTLPSVITIPCGAAAAAFRWFANAPLYWSQTSGAAVGATAPATLINASTLTVAPVVFLS